MKKVFQVTNPAPKGFSIDDSGFLTRIITPPFRVSYPYLDEPTAYEEGKEKKFSVTALFDARFADLKPLRQLLIDTLAKKYGPEQKKWPSPLNMYDFSSYLSATGKDGWPLRDGMAFPDRDGYGEGIVFAKFSNTRRPIVVDRTQMPIDPKDVYPGCWARAIISAFCPKVAAGVVLSLQIVQKLGEGAPFSGGTASVDDLPDDSDLPADFS